jgi:hypothetical protein
MAASLQSECLEDIILNFALREGVVEPERQTAHVINRQLLTDARLHCLTHQVIPTAQVQRLALELGALVYREYAKHGPVVSSGLRGSEKMLLLYSGGSQIHVLHIVRGLLIGRSLDLWFVQIEQTGCDVYRTESCPGYCGDEEFTLAPYRFSLATDFDQDRYETELGRKSSRTARAHHGTSSIDLKRLVWAWSPSGSY